MRWLLAGMLVLGGCTAGPVAPCAREAHIPRVVSTYGAELARKPHQDPARERMLVNIAYGRMYQRAMPLTDEGGGGHVGVGRCGY